MSSPATRVTGASSQAKASCPMAGGDLAAEAAGERRFVQHERAGRLPHRREHRVAVPRQERPEVDHLDGRRSATRSAASSAQPTPTPHVTTVTSEPSRATRAGPIGSTK